MKTSIDDAFSPEEDSRLNNGHVGEAVSIENVMAALQVAETFSNQLRKHNYWGMIEVFKCRFKGTPHNTRALITILVRIRLNPEYCTGDVSQQFTSNWIDLRARTHIQITQDLLVRVQNAIAKVGEELCEKGSELLSTV
jgi:hypothetical protein